MNKGIIVFLIDSNNNKKYKADFPKLDSRHTTFELLPAQFKRGVPMFVLVCECGKSASRLDKS